MVSTVERGKIESNNCHWYSKNQHSKLCKSDALAEQSDLSYLIPFPLPLKPHSQLKPQPTMSSEMSGEKNSEKRTQWVYDEKTFPVWNQSFEMADRTEMIRQDLWAGRSIAILLVVLVAVGLSLSVLTVAFLATWR